MEALYHHPEHLEPDPGKREFSCPVAFPPPKSPIIGVRDVRAEIIKSKTKTEALSALLKWAAQNGINSGTEPEDEWWKKREKLGV